MAKKKKSPIIPGPYLGRKVIYSNVDRITKDNVLDVFEEAMITHLLNSGEIQYLWEYYKGNQPILYRIKTIRPEINNMIVENRANEIVSFKVGYLCGEPIQYISRKTDEKVSQQIDQLNELMFSENKANKDREIVEWQMICGTAYRLCVPDKGEILDSPFNIYTLDPRNTFVVYSTDVEHKPLMSCCYTLDTLGNPDKVTCYTDNQCFVITSGGIVEERPFVLKKNPIIEYPANNARQGCFEIVLPLLDAINEVESNRLDSVQQFVQSFLKFINCDVDEEQLAALKELGAIKIKSVDGQNADVDLITSELNQAQTQTLADNLYETVLTICGMPNRNGGTSTSDTGAAVVLRDGWSLAEARAKDSELMFKASEREFLRIALSICKRQIPNFDLELKDVDMQFTRRNYENIQSKAQVLISMLQNDKIHPLLAFTHCGMFSDPEAAYQMSLQHYEETINEYVNELDNINADEVLTDENV